MNNREMPIETSPNVSVTASAAAAAAPDGVLHELGSGLQGISSQEARARLTRFGPNAVGVESRSLRSIVLEQARNGINL
ncbi:MAG TPA: cation-transporting P-type ATPase, partial [Candidatus Dormibacteraeota bacterium]|nr:cation-transporting P-type ATPase [Candidatus Dormibacteraeota bacterium]